MILTGLNSSVTCALTGMDCNIIITRDNGCHGEGYHAALALSTLTFSCVYHNQSQLNSSDQLTLMFRTCVQVILMGLDSAGKSTLLAKLLTGQVSFLLR